jgi:hypothetical protein
MHAELKITSHKADLTSFTELFWHHPGRNEGNQNTSCGQQKHLVIQICKLACLSPQPTCLVKKVPNLNIRKKKKKKKKYIYIYIKCMYKE